MNNPNIDHSGIMCVCVYIDGKTNDSFQYVLVLLSNNPSVCCVLRSPLGPFARTVTVIRRVRTFAPDVSRNRSTNAKSIFIQTYF